MIGVVQQSLGHILVAQKRYVEAEKELTAAYEILSQRPAAVAARLQTARQDLATVYEALKQPQRAAAFRSPEASQGH